MNADAKGKTMTTARDLEVHLKELHAEMVKEAKELWRTRQGAWGGSTGPHMTNYRVTKYWASQLAEIIDGKNYD